MSLQTTGAPSQDGGDFSLPLFKVFDLGGLEPSCTLSTLPAS